MKWRPAIASINLGSISSQQGSARCCTALLLSGLLLVLTGCDTEPVSPPEAADTQQVARPSQQQIDQLYQQGLAHIKKRNFQAAAHTFQQVIQFDSTHYDAWLGLGKLFTAAKQKKKARYHLQKAYQLDPSRIEARYQLAQNYYLAGNARFAGIPTKSSSKQISRQLFTEIVADYPHNLRARMMLAETWMMVPPPDAELALAQYDTILQIKPNYRDARAGRGASRLRLGQTQQGAAEIAQVLEEGAPDPHLSFLLGTAYYQLGQYERAVDTFTYSIDALFPAPLPTSPPRVIERWNKRLHVRQWNLRLAYQGSHGEYPGDLAEKYQIHLAPVAEESPVRFTDMGPIFGVDKYDRGRGSAWGDYDHDGDLDLFTTGIHTTHALYRNEDGAGFTDIAQAAGLKDPRGGWGASCADYDNDGWLDLYVSRDAWEGGTPNSLYRNQGNSTFIEVSEEAGVDDPDASFTHTWGDYDNDGWLDLYVAEGVTGDGTPNKLFHNQRDGTFKDRAAEAGVGHTGKTLGVAFGDYDNDGDLDLYASDVGGPSTLYRNNGDGTFADVTLQAGVDRPHAGSYVTFFFDYNGDGHLDLFVGAFAYYESAVESLISGRGTGPSFPHLYRNNGDGTFVNVSTKSCLSRAVGSMGAGFGDVDYDGLIDIYLSNGGPNYPRLEPNLLYLNKGNDQFADITASAGVGHIGKGHGVSFADYDNDGDLDIYAGVGGHYPGDLWHNSLYRNEGHDNHWLVVEVRSSPNRYAVGTRLRIRAGDLVQDAEISTGNGFGCTNSFPMEFGLGHRTRVDALEIRWPSGRTETHRDLDVDQVLVFEEGG